MFLVFLVFLLFLIGSLFFLLVTSVILSQS